jgi:hypothetical protein
MLAVTTLITMALAAMVALLLRAAARPATG